MYDYIIIAVFMTLPHVPTGTSTNSWWVLVGWFGDHGKWRTIVIDVGTCIGTHVCAHDELNPSKADPVDGLCVVELHPLCDGWRVSSLSSCMFFIYGS